MAADRPTVLYPAYFDLGRSRDEGRRVAKKLAVESPTTEEIAKAARALGLAPEIEATKAHPVTPWKREGRVLVKSDFFKTSVVRRVAEKVKAGRQK